MQKKINLQYWLKSQNVQVEQLKVIQSNWFENDESSWEMRMRRISEFFFRLRFRQLQDNGGNSSLTECGIDAAPQEETQS